MKNFELKVSCYQEPFDIMGVYNIMGANSAQPRGLVRSEVGDGKVTDMKVADVKSKWAIY